MQRREGNQTRCLDVYETLGTSYRISHKCRTYEVYTMFWRHFADVSARLSSQQAIAVLYVRAVTSCWWTQRRVSLRPCKALPGTCADTPNGKNSGDGRERSCTQLMQLIFLQKRGYSCCPRLALARLTLGHVCLVSKFRRSPHHSMVIIFIICVVHICIVLVQDCQAADPDLTVLEIPWCHALLRELRFSTNIDCILMLHFLVYLFAAYVAL